MFERIILDGLCGDKELLCAAITWARNNLAGTEHLRLMPGNL